MKNLFSLIKSTTSKPTARSMAEREFAEAKRQLLQHQSAAEYHTHMTAYYEQKILRLKAYMVVEDKLGEKR